MDMILMLNEILEGYVQMQNDDKGVAYDNDGTVEKNTTSRNEQRDNQLDRRQVSVLYMR